jgi:hypothetical protein
MAGRSMPFPSPISGVGTNSRRSARETQETYEALAGEVNADANLDTIGAQWGIKGRS